MTKAVSKAQASSGAAKASNQTAHKATKKNTQRPVQPGQRFYVQWRTGEQHVAEVIETRPYKRSAEGLSSKDTNGSVSTQNQQLEYYVHYVSYDRRLDEWVSLDRIDTSRHVVVVSGDGLEATGGDDGRNGHTRRNKKNGPGTGHADSKDGPTSLEKEHEEITRVKNIQNIELGQFEIETWYFSPYPG